MLDRRDLDILGMLQRDGRATYAEIAKHVGLSPSSVHQRVRKLEQSGIIRGYRAVLNLEEVGLFVTALVSITPLDPKQPDDLPDRVMELPRRPPSTSRNSCDGSGRRPASRPAPPSSCRSPSRTARSRRSAQPFERHRAMNPDLRSVFDPVSADVHRS